MITKKQAIEIGRAMVLGAMAERANNYEQQDLCFEINGSLHRMLNNLWYDVFTNKLKEQFGFSNEKFIETCHSAAGRSKSEI